MSYSKLRTFAHSEDQQQAYILEHSESPLSRLRVLRLTNNGVGRDQSSEVLTDINLASEEKPTCCDAARIGSTIALAVGYQRGHVRVDDLCDNGWVAMCLPPSELKDTSAATVVRWNPFFTSQLLSGYSSSAGMVSLFSTPCASRIRTRVVRAEQANASVVAAEWAPHNSGFLSHSHAAVSANNKGGGNFQVSILDFRTDEVKEELRLGSSNGETNNFTNNNRRTMSARNSQVGHASSVASEQISHNVVAASGLSFHPSRPWLATYGNATELSATSSNNSDQYADFAPIIQIWDLRSAASPIGQFNKKSLAARGLDLSAGIWDLVWAKTISPHSPSPNISLQQANSISNNCDTDQDDYSPIALFGATPFDLQQHKGAGQSLIGLLSTKELPDASKKRVGSSALTIQTKLIGEPITSIAMSGNEIICHSQHGYLTNCLVTDIIKAHSNGDFPTIASPSDSALPTFIDRADKGFGVNLNQNGHILVSELKAAVAAVSEGHNGALDLGNTVEWTILTAFVETHRQQQAPGSIKETFLTHWGTEGEGFSRTKQQIAGQSPITPSLLAQPEALSSLREALLWEPSDTTTRAIPWLSPTSNRYRRSFIEYAQGRLDKCVATLRLSEPVGTLGMVTSMLAFVVDSQLIKSSAPPDHTLSGLKDTLSKDQGAASSACYLLALIDMIAGTKPMDLLAGIWRGTASQLTSPVGTTSYTRMPPSPEKSLLPFDLLVAATLVAQGDDPKKVLETIVTFPVTTRLPIQLLLKGINEITLKEARIAISGPEDVQCAVAFFAPLGIQFEKQQERDDKKKTKTRTAPTQWRQWHEQYRGHLDAAGQMLIRAEYDLSLRLNFDFGLVHDNEGNIVSGEAPRDVEFKHTCEWSLHLNPNKKALGPHDCSYPMPKCGVCGINIERALPANLSSPSQWLAWCTNCGHGGHSGHLDEWFERHEMCPYPACPCSCRSSLCLGGDTEGNTLAVGLSNTAGRQDLVTAISSNPNAIVAERPSENTSKWGDIVYHFIEFPAGLRL